MRNRIFEFYEKYKSECMALKKAFWTFEDNKWSAQTYCLELSIQLNHFIFVTLGDGDVKEMLKENFRNLNDIVDEICDVLYQVINVMSENDICFERDLECSRELMMDSQRKNICNILCGQIGDAVLRKEHLKHSVMPVDKENELILKNCFYIMNIMFCYIEEFNININEAFSKMLEEARGYIEQYSVLNDGFHSKIEKREIVEKEILKSRMQKLGYQYKVSDMKLLIMEYVDRIKFNNIVVIKPISVIENDKEIIIQQIHVKGVRLDELIKLECQKTDYLEKLIDVFVTVISDIVCLYHKDKDIRIDCNLCNFIVSYNDGEYFINLIDIYPPIMISKIDKKTTDENNMVYQLSTDIRLSLYAFLYYFVRTVLRNFIISTDRDRMEIKKIVNKLLCEGTERIGKIECLENEKNLKFYEYYITKIDYMKAYCDLYGKEQEKALMKIKEWSIRKEMGLIYEL